MICGSKANKLNRDVTLWFFIGLIFPILALIFIYSFNPKTKYNPFLNSQYDHSKNVLKLQNKK